MRPIVSLACVAIVAALCIASLGCLTQDDVSYPDTEREDMIPASATKGNPETDLHPPILHSGEYEQPVPLPHPVNTAGAEDSPFVLPDGNTLYFFFTPDVSVPPEGQLLDNVTGVWVTSKKDGEWDNPQRVWLSDPGTLALDGAVAIDGDTMYFASAREGYTGVNLFSATFSDGSWSGWEYAGARLNKEILAGECHLHGDYLYFHSDRLGGMSGFDIWYTERDGDTWSDPIPIEQVNTAGMDGFPYVSSDGYELWFTRTYLGTPAIYRSMKTISGWGEPELIVSQFAGEPTLDNEGNLYFVHHFYEDGVMIEADIYVAYRK